MKLRAMLVVAGLVVWAVLVGETLGAGGPVNLLTNGSFEEGLTGWQPDAQHKLVTEAGASRTGKACLSGEATGPRQALRLRRRVKVRAGNLYQFVIWARATNRTKLVLWAGLPGARTRSMVASWKSVPRRWRRYATALTIQRDGMLDLEIIAPSSHSAPAGRMWIDDLALIETPMPPAHAVSKGVGFNDEPAIARASDGTIVVAWNSFRPSAAGGSAGPAKRRDGADSLQVARFRPQSKGFQPLGAWQVVGGKGTYIMGIAAAPAGKDVAVVYAAEVDGNWDIYAVPCGAGGPGEPVAVTRDAAADLKPAAAWHDGTLWVAWESSRNGSRQILAAPVRGGKAPPPVPLSAAGASCYEPSVAVLASGEVCVSWHGFRKGNYDVFLRRRGADGTWRPERRLTRAPGVDRHARLAARNDELWVVYENAQTAGYRIGTTNRRRLIVAKVTPKGPMAPRGYAASPLYQERCEGGAAAFDGVGRLWLSYLKPRLPRAGWDAFVTCFNGSAWQRPAPVSFRKGMDRRPGLVLCGDRAVVAIQSDDIPNSWSTVDRTPEAKSDIFLASVDVGSAPKADAMALAPLVEPNEPFEAATLRIERGEEAATPAITYNGQKLKLFYGDLHEHSDVSVCNRVGDQSIDESYQHMRDIARLDFACVTDHGYNLNPYLWGMTAKLARANEDAGRYLTFLAEEWTSSFEKYSTKHPYGYYGHHNLILADTYFPRWWNARNGQTPAQVWEDLRKMKANFALIPHQLADTGNVPTDWNYTDEQAQPVAEIFQTRGSYEYKGAPREAGRSTPKRGYFLQDAWARGIVIGVIASPDHGGGRGKACVYATDLTREAILDGLRARRCFGTTAARIFLDVRVNGHLMGEKVAAAAGKSVEVKIHVRCPADIDRVEVCRSNKYIYTHRPKGRSAELTFTDRAPLPGRSYYYVRVIQKDEEIAWTSPVWFGAK
jgi:hypothetical protein